MTARQTGHVGRGARVRGALIALPFLWLAVFLGVPTIGLVVYSLWHYQQFVVYHHWTLANYSALFSGTNLIALGTTLELSLLTVAIGLPFAFVVALYTRSLSRRWAYLVLLILVLPFLTNQLLRTFAWRYVLGRDGLVNTLLVHIGIGRVDWLLFSRFSLIVVLIFGVLPFMALPIYASLSRVDDSIVLAALDLGANTRQILFRVVIPIARPGIAVGALLAFVTTIGVSVEPSEVGSPSDLVWGQLIATNAFDLGNVPQAAAYAVVLGLIILVVLLATFRFVKLDELFGTEGRR